MALVCLKCPNCSGSLQMEDTLEKGFCMYCGSPFMVKEEIQRIQVEHSGTVNMNLNRIVESNNISTLGRIKFEENRCIDIAGCNLILDKYVEKALTLDITNEKALALKRDVESRIKNINDEKQKQEELRIIEEEKKQKDFRDGAVIIGLIFGILLLINLAYCASLRG